MQYRQNSRELPSPQKFQPARCRRAHSWRAFILYGGAVTYAMQIKTTVTAYLKSEQLLLFVCAQQSLRL